MSRPLVTIGVPVYNDEEWLERSLDRIINQNYDNLEILVIDDLSSDRSIEICKEFANKDKRIRFIQNKFNLGALKTHNLLFELSRGDYFAWGSGHDYFHTSFVSRCLEVLEQDNSIANCYTQAQYISYDETPANTTTELLDIRSANPVERFITLIRGAVNPNMFYGIFRSSILINSELHRKMMGGDLLFFAEIALLGKIVQIDEVLMYRKMNRANETAEDCAERWIRNIIKPKGIGLEGITPWLDMAVEYLKIADAASLTSDEKELLFTEVIKYCKRTFGSNIDKDIKSLLEFVKTLNPRFNKQINLLRFYANGVTDRFEKAKIFVTENIETPGSKDSKLESSFKDSNISSDNSLQDSLYLNRKESQLPLQNDSEFTDNGIWTPQTYMLRSIRDIVMQLEGSPRLALSIDKNPTLEQIIRRKWPEIAITVAQYPDYDIQNLHQFPDSKFDLVYSHQVLEHVPKPWIAAKEIVRVLKKGGIGIHSSCAFNPKHGQPQFNDYYRFLPDGLAELFDGITVLVKEGWGNRQALLYNLAIDDGHGELGGRRFVEALAAKNEINYPWHTWVIFQKL